MVISNFTIKYFLKWKIMIGKLMRKVGITITGQYLYFRWNNFTGQKQRLLFMKLNLRILAPSFLLFTQIAFSQEEAEKNIHVTDPMVLEKLEQWRDLKFGLLRHWDTYCQWGVVESWSICLEDYGWCECKEEIAGIILNM
jgi:hypothetical protein